MNKSTIKARFFGAHIGCRAKINDKENIFELVGLDYDFGNIEAVCLHSDSGGVEVHRVSLNDCKLVLRPLSSITLVECRNYVKSIAPGANDIEESAMILYKGMKDKNRITATTHCGFVDYARSINICVQFMGHDPITEGWAILDQKFLENH